MEIALEKALNTAKKLEYLQKNMLHGNNSISYRSPDNILALLVAFNPDIGYIENGKVIIKMGGWGHVINIVKNQIGLDLLEHDVDDLKQKDRVDNTAVIPNDKLFSKPPTKGFVECRLLGDNEKIVEASDNYAHRQTKENAYLGVDINELIKWDIDNIIIIENFNAFCRLNEQHAHVIDGLHGSITALIYRGHDNKNITPILKTLAQKDCKRYVFADYDLAGLRIAESISKSMKAHGYILPYEPWNHNDEFNTMTVTSNRQKQSSIKTNLASLKPYLKHITDEYLAVPQETLIARKTRLVVVDV